MSRGHKKGHRGGEGGEGEGSFGLEMLGCSGISKANGGSGVGVLSMVEIACHDYLLTDYVCLGSFCSGYVT